MISSSIIHHSNFRQHLPVNKQNAQRVKKQIFQGNMALPFFSSEIDFILKKTEEKRIKPQSQATRLSKSKDLPWQT